MEPTEREEKETAFRLQMYKIADANHRFYVDKRFKIISLYYPSTTLVLTALYYIARDVWYLQTLFSLVGVLLTLFLYALESRNWILTNACSRSCVRLGCLLEGHNGSHIMSSFLQSPFACIFNSYRQLVRKIAPTQHKAVEQITGVLVAFWLVLMFISLPTSIYGEFLRGFGLIRLIYRSRRGSCPHLVAPEG